MKIRYAELKDLPRLNEIYNYYVISTNMTFDVTVPTAESRKKWFSNYQESGPYRLLVAEKHGAIVGLAYSSRYREHFAFDQTIETSIYLDKDFKRSGIGSALYTELFSKLKTEPIHVAVAGIALPNEGSIALHKKFGFEPVGIFKEYAIKKGQYISSLWMQKRI